jgi:hypothetical protein
MSPRTESATIFKYIMSPRTESANKSNTTHQPDQVLDPAAGPRNEPSLKFNDEPADEPSLLEICGPAPAPVVAVATPVTFSLVDEPPSVTVCAIPPAHVSTPPPATPGSLVGANPPGLAPQVINHLELLLNEMKSLKTIIEKQNEQIEKQNEQIEKQNEKIEKQNEKIEMLCGEIVNLKSELTNLKSELTNLKSELKEKDEIIKKQKDQIAELSGGMVSKTTWFGGRQLSKSRCFAWFMVSSKPKSDVSNHALPLYDSQSPPSYSLN